MREKDKENRRAVSIIVCSACFSTGEVTVFLNDKLIRRDCPICDGAYKPSPAPAPSGGPCIIMDLDLTIADPSKRWKVADAKAERFSSAWYEVVHISEGIETDAPYAHAAERMNEIVNAGVSIIYLTGRREPTRKATVEWLAKWGFPRGEKLIMRQDDEYKLTTAEYKRRQLEALLEDGYLIVGAFDDEKDVVRMYAGRGIPVMWVDSPDFWSGVGISGKIQRF